MQLFEAIMAGLLAVVVLFLFWPGAKRAMRESREVENPDWMSALIPLVLVGLFVFFLIVMSNN